MPKSPEISSADDNISTTGDNQASSPGEGFALRLRACAEKNGWKQAELARRSGIAPALIGAYWHGKKRPARDKLFDLAAALDVDPRWLAGGASATATASHILNEIDLLIEGRRDDEASARRAELVGIANDPDLAPSLQHRADFILKAMGDDDAKRRYREAARSTEKIDLRNRQVIQAAFDRACETLNVELGNEALQALTNLCRFMLLERPEKVGADIIHVLVKDTISAFVSALRQH
jgi:transcriptional regulator with XRE-family HTH domain